MIQLLPEDRPTILMNAVWTDRIEKVLVDYPGLSVAQGISAAVKKSEEVLSIPQRTFLKIEIDTVFAGFVIINDLTSQVIHIVCRKQFSDTELTIKYNIENLLINA